MCDPLTSPMARLVPTWRLVGAAVLVAGLLAGCGGGDTPAAGAADGAGRSERPAGGRPERSEGGGRGGQMPARMGGFSGAEERSAIPVEVAPVIRRDVSDFLETTGKLEAEREVDIVARTSGPIVELLAEEGDLVEEGQLLARIDDAELQAQLEVSRVSLEEARVAFERAKQSLASEIISQEAFDQAKARFDGAAAQIRGLEIQLGYTRIVAPFRGRIIERVVKYQEYVTNGSRLFRISDFDPLLCPIQIPEKDLARLRIGQPAYLTVESYPGERFGARVLRINPVVDAQTGTVKVTLEVSSRGRLRPGMFASVNLQTAVHEDSLVIPKRALVLESIGDTVYVLADGVAERREVELGFEEADAVEVLAGLEEGEEVVVVGQDSLSQGTPIYVLDREEPPAPALAGPMSRGPAAGGAVGASGPPNAPGAAGTPSAGGPGRRGGYRDIDWNDPAQVERIKGFMRQRGLSEEQIEQRIERMKRGEFPQRRPPGS